MRIRDRPGLVLAIVVVTFIAALTLSLYVQSYGNTASNSSRPLEIVIYTYVQYYVVPNNQNGTTTTITQAWVYSQPVPCAYHTQ